ncbi:uncharacterized protein ColSpa_06805 [Colletotrichum spaethianum]|uniref:BTB domain-containing protein n=1 Tax=Colletotrichum spaethianum TaxID=700344 RepID=A0AA37P804_9PEZI|nr:uncharacterized protein ColSpa_06805 [Colletotrichum spaethianum]GKT46624.1 hypothetical protein ColSpa_06805 [Colletotrichum spaethianum]
MTNADQQLSSDSAESAAPSELVTYDKDGDLTVRVGPKLKPYRIDSKTLCRSSPIFKKMLYGGFAESRPSNGSDWTIALPDDHCRSIGFYLASSMGLSR